MATLREALDANRVGLIPIERTSNTGGAMSDSLEPVFNPMLRCPLPSVLVAPDSLRQFYLGGKVPQMRILAPPSINSNTGNTASSTTTTATIVSTGSSSSSASAITVQQTALTTNVLVPNGQYLGFMPLSKAFQLVFLSANQACRVRFYGTSDAQVNDSGRALDAPPAPGIQNLITDVALDVSPYQWSFQNRVGANGSNPQTPLAYVTVTNLSAVTTAFTIVLSYAILGN